MTYFPLHQTTCFFIPLVAPCKPLLGMTVAPDKRDNNVEGRNVYELFNYQIINPMIRKNSGLLI